jgi:hypothetical protein
VTFPIDAGQFYANHLLKLLPAGRRLDLKKTQYKKFSTFLKLVNEEGEWVVKTSSRKGVDSIDDVKR